MNSEKVLVVDDCDETQGIVRDLVAAMGGHTIPAGCSEQAKYLLVAEKPDVLIVGLAPPLIDGRDLSTFAGKIASALPTIFLVTSGAAAQAFDAIYPDVSAFVKKPIDPAELLCALIEVMGRSKASAGPERTRLLLINQLLRLKQHRTTLLNLKRNLEGSSLRPHYC